MRLYIIRHGETPWNQEKRLQGQTDIALNENGRSLAEVTARALRNVPFDLAFTSPLIRAEETARIILGGREIPVLADKRIQEICFGRYEGERFKDAAGTVTNPTLRNFFRQPEQYKAPEDGERLEDLCERTGDFLRELAGRPELFRKTILVSTHGAASRALLLNMKKRTLADFWDTGVPKNCAVTIAELMYAKEGTDHTEQKQQQQKICGISDSQELAADRSPQWIIIEQDKVYYENI